MIEQMKIANTFLFLLFSFSLFAQDNYKAEIKTHRANYLEEFRKSDYSPFYHHPKMMKKMKFYKANDEYIVQAKVELTPQSEQIQMATYSGKQKTFKQYANLTFELDGQSITMAIYQNLKTISNPLYRDYLFLPFMDASSGESTYGGGRYLDFKTGDIKDGILLIDFNKAYNPYCAYSDGYNCPVPPIVNHLDIAIQAGEKNYKGKKLHRS